MRRLRTQVAIIGAGPAGLVLADLLHRAGVDFLVVERRSREHVETRPRAGLLEHRVVETLRRHGLAGRLLAEGVRHGWCDFRCLGRSVRVDYGALSGGLRHWVYPQQLLVRDLIAQLERAGRAPLFGTAVRALSEVTGPRPRVLCDGLEIACDHVIGADGFRGVSRAALPPGHRVLHRRYPYDWLTVQAEVDRPVAGVVYAVSPDGFAGMMPRTSRLARFYLQCAPGDTPERWPAGRVREQLAARLGEELPRIGDLLEVRVLRMRGSVTEPPRHGRLLLAGDAAHLLTPSGAKGMNLAIADAVDLADALVRHHRDGDDAALDGYARRRLAEVWRVQEFSDRLLRLLHLPADAGDDPRFALRLRLAAFQRLAEPGPHATAFAHAYVGSGAEGTEGGAAWRC
ncbi:4-hydroxybenzoate 3-monooxygenase [Streptomyces litchfieldiae]|uniref:4-hydroxybenzoate 3-monooxygenase n=1 Tax=Streptomyces litchfieldiae TaxID=3075543 RepID=A0ABU2MKJ7_9ACTN|nr:4-hydroxybenzoate 3-monooxygenase [Streptomyces sp. DSM 44938]MDT0342001.1 4-hydroxybenzoate 3-monooxygenase [Streptomyces sp. DSM 44938]